MLYHAYEMTHAALAPMRQMARLGREALQSPSNPLAKSYGARVSAAGLDMFIKATKRYAKPEFGLETTVVEGIEVSVTEEITMALPFCELLHFKRDTTTKHQKLLIIAPLSGHYATLLRGTVKEMLPDHDVYITDWVDSRDVPLSAGGFDLDDYVDYLVQFCEKLGEDGTRPAVLAVCQPGVPMLVAASLMAAENAAYRPSSITLMGSPIDTAKNPKKPNELATSKPLSWFEQNVITRVPWPNTGFMRRVYPGFLQLSGFMSMNLDRHVDAHTEHFRNMVKGDGDSTEAHRRFYDEYMAVMDLSASYYLQTIERVFQKRLLATGAYYYRDTLIDPAKITDIALMTVEGEKDDITGLGQTEAAHRLVNVPKKMRQHHVQAGVGHYGVFNGSRWRGVIAPKVKAFVAAHARG
ncbi:MAG: polyhydroxyalkanoate depolymerase [Rhodobacteraceae bacterium]|nr:polyhydroxyalkanoate depolymerase [Paracoccaceae bacterium]